MNLRLLNIVSGFFLLFASACGGFFLSLNTQTALSHDPQMLSSSLYIMQKSSHSHTNLFALIHIVFALTLKDSKLSLQSKKYQTIALFLGSFTMSMLMLTRSFFPGDLALLKYVSAIFLCFFLLALLSHCYGVLRKLIS